MKAALRKVFRSLGYEVRRIAPDPTHRLDRFFLTIQSLGFKPKFVIDVGANHGNWSRKMLKVFPDASVTMIEPQAHLKNDVKDLLKRPNIKWISAGAGAENTRMMFTVAKRDYMSNFLMSSEEAARRGLEQVEVPVVTVNSVVAEAGGVIPDMIKVDAEGLDLKVIDGASDVLGKTEVILLEITICATGLDNTAVNTIAKMDAAGYELFSITDLNYSHYHDVLWLIEAAFIRKDGPLKSQVLLAK